MVPALLILLSLNTVDTDLGACVRFWQREMGLLVWNISIKVVGRSELTDGTVGRIDTDAKMKTAVIRVLDPHDSDLPLDQALADQLLTVAHEMVHLKRLVRDRSPFWQDEPTTNEQTLRLLRRYRRLVELSVAESQ